MRHRAYQAAGHRPRPGSRPARHWDPGGVDPDPAGRRAAIRAYHLLSPLTTKLTAAILPAGKDPAHILASHGLAALARLLAGHTVPLADLVIDDEIARWSRWLRYPEGQINALRAVAPLIAAMPAADVACQVAQLADRLGLSYPTVTDAVTSALHDLYDKSVRGPHPRRTPGCPRPDQQAHTQRRSR
jgi:DNA primase